LPQRLERRAGAIGRIEDELDEAFNGLGHSSVVVFEPLVLVF
jgi:hypothetical protein